jgi:hypothetical protein
MKIKTFEPVAAGCRGFAATSKNRQTASRQVVLNFPRKKIGDLMDSLIFA